MPASRSLTNRACGRFRFAPGWHTVEDTSPRDGAGIRPSCAAASSCPRRWAEATGDALAEAHGDVVDRHHIAVPTGHTLRSRLLIVRPSDSEQQEERTQTAGSATRRRHTAGRTGRRRTRRCRRPTGGPFVAASPGWPAGGQVGDGLPPSSVSTPAPGGSQEDGCDRPAANARRLATDAISTASELR